MAADSTAPSYWLNLRFLVCVIWVLVAMVFSALLIWRHEGRRIYRNRSSEEIQQEAGCLYEDEVWGTCSQSVHPIFLLAYRIIAFCALLALLIADIITRGAIQYFFYTVWTFTLVTIYFGVGSLLSICGCLHYYHKGKAKRDFQTCTDAQTGSYVPPSLMENAVTLSQNERSSHCGELNCRTFASSWGYSLQIIFQMCAGSVALTDSVFWMVLYPYFSARRLNFLIVCKHSVNAIFLLGDAILNRLRFPFFRIAYFVLWTCVYAIFQWIIHAFLSIRWPYPFMDLSSSYAPLWYLAVGLLLFPCFGIFTLIFRLKRCFTAR